MDPRLKLAHLLKKRAALPTRAKLDAFLAGESDLAATVGIDAEARLELMRNAHALLAAGDAPGALEVIELLAALGQRDVVVVVLWAQATAALGRYDDALAANDVAVALADEGNYRELASSCRAFRETLERKATTK